MFKIAEELMQKISEVVEIKKPALAEGTMKMVSKCECGSHCSFACGRACSSGCSSNSRL